MVMSDRQIEGACKLYGVPFDDLGRIAREVIPRAWRCRLRRYVLMRSPLGGEFGRWELVPLQHHSQRTR